MKKEPHDDGRRTAKGQLKIAKTRIRIVTNLPQRLPVLPAEIALIETYWAAFSQMSAGNDNQDLL